MIISPLRSNTICFLIVCFSCPPVLTLHIYKKKKIQTSKPPFSYIPISIQNKGINKGYMFHAAQKTSCYIIYKEKYVDTVSYGWVRVI